jgi:hypothetical protein
MYQDYLNCPWPLSVQSQGKLHSSFTIYNLQKTKMLSRTKAADLMDTLQFTFC